MKNQFDHFLQSRYDALWAQSIGRIHAGTVEIDPVLAENKGDRRRGMTLLFRPPSQIRSRITEMLEELRALEPEQRYYDPAEMHVTLLSMFTARENNEALFERSEKFAVAITSWARGIAPFSLSYVGLTASPAAIMVQGFTDPVHLNAARDRLRNDLRAADLGRGLDERYRLEVAHMTVVRFRHLLRDGAAFARALQRLRTFDFGRAEVDSLELFKSDWYMSRTTMESLGTFKVGGA